MICSKPRPLIALLAILFIDTLALALVYPLFTPLILESTTPLLPANFSLSTRLFLLTLLIASFPFMQLLGGPIIGHLADTHPRKKVFSITLIGEAVGLILSALAMEVMSYPFLICARLMTGFFAGNLLLCFTSFADLSDDPKERTKIFGLAAAFAGTGFVIAIILGGVLSNTALAPFFSPSFPFYLAGVFTLINLAIVWVDYEETRGAIKSPIGRIASQCRELISFLKTKRLGTIYLTFFFFMLGWVLILQFLPTLLVEHFAAKKMTITLLFIGLGIIWCFGNVIINPILNAHFSPKAPLLGGLILSTLTFFISSQTHSFLLFSHLILIGAFAASLVWTNSLALIAAKAARPLMGKMMGISQSVAAGAMALAPFFGGLAGEYDVLIIYLVAAAAFLIATVTFTFYLSVRER